MKHTRLEAIEKSDADRFLVLYKAQIYKDDNFATKNDLMTCEQLETESSSDNWLWISTSRKSQFGL